MEDAYSLELKRTIGIGEAHALFRGGTLKDKHAFSCAFPRCPCPVKICAVDPGKDVAPYFQSCGCRICLARMGTTTKDGKKPAERHDPTRCEYASEERNSARPDETRRIIGGEIIRVKTGTRISMVLPPAPTAVLPPGPPVALSPVPATPAVAPSGGARPVVTAQSQWGLFRIIDTLRNWSAADLDVIRFDLGGLRATGDIFRRLGDLKHLHLRASSPFGPKTPTDPENRREYSDVRHIFFGSARLEPLHAAVARIVFDVPLEADGERRVVTVDLTDALFRVTRHKARLRRLFADVGFSSSTAMPCVAFVLGTLATVQRNAGAELIPARTLDDVIVLPRSTGTTRTLNLFLEALEARRQAERVRLRAERERQERLRAEAEALAQSRREAEAQERARVAQAALVKRDVTYPAATVPPRPPQSATSLVSSRAFSAAPSSPKKPSRFLTWVRRLFGG